MNTTSIDRLKSILNTKGKPVKVVLTERELTEEEEGLKPIDHLTVEKAVEVCTVLYEDDVQGPIMYEILTDEKRCNEVKITEEIKTKTKETLDAYRLSLFNRKIAGEELSDYNQALSKFVAVPSRLIRRNQAGLAITLPRFRATDLLKESISSCHDSMPDMKISWDKFTEQKPAKLIPVDWIEERNSRRHVKTYLFTANSLDPKARPILTYKVSYSNKQAITAWDHLFNKGDVLSVRMRAKTEPWIGNFNAMDITDLEIVEKKVDNQ